MGNPVVFDIDGTLIDSRTAVARAYRLAGVEMPEESWGTSWLHWLPVLCDSMDDAIRVHDVKNDIYASFFENGAIREFPAAQVARDLVAEGVYDVHLVSSASRSTVSMVAAYLRLPHGVIASAGGPRSARSSIVSSIGGPGVYVDDLIDDLDIDKDEWHVVQYTGQSKNSLREELLWTLSSWQEGRALG